MKTFNEITKQFESKIPKSIKGFNGLKNICFINYEMYTAFIENDDYILITFKETEKGIVKADISQNTDKPEKWLKTIKEIDPEIEVEYWEKVLIKKTV